MPCAVRSGSAGEVRVTAVLAAEAIVLVLLCLLVVGLLRSHAEILRRLDSLERGSPTMPPLDLNSPPAPPRPEAAPVRDGGRWAPDVGGRTIGGDAVQISPSTGDGGTLLAFLTSGCATCQGFWEAIGAPSRAALPVGTRVVVVAKDPQHEHIGKLRDLAPSGVPLVLSSAAWEAYQVPASPYFVFVDGATGTVHGEGVGETWDQVISLLSDALWEGDASAMVGPPDEPVRGGPARGLRADAELAAAGIGDGHPSLYEAGDGRGQGDGR
jgi:hypothetical protein